MKHISYNCLEVDTQQSSCQQCNAQWKKNSVKQERNEEMKPLVKKNLSYKAEYYYSILYKLNKNLQSYKVIKQFSGMLPKNIIVKKNLQNNYNIVKFE